MPFQFRRFDRTIKALLGLAVFVAVVVAAFDWNWFRHPLERYLAERSHREVRIGDLHVRLGFSLEPTVRMRDVYIENASWADKQPFLTAREVSFTFSLKSIREKQPVISRLVLIDADLDMERQADGLRNWRLKNPGDRGPGKVKVQSIEPHGVKIRFVRRDVGLDVTASSKPSQLGAEELGPDAAHPTRIDFKGEIGGAEFAGAVVTGEVLTFLDTRRSFPIRGHASSGKTRLVVDGSIADMFHPTAIDAKMHVTGPSLAALHGFFHRPLPASRPYDFAARVRQTRQEITVAELQGRIGASDLAGDISIDRGRERMTVKAALRSESADVADLRSLFARESADKTAAVPEDPAPGGRKDSPLKPLFSAREFDATNLQKLDAHATLDFKKLKAGQLPALESLHATADLKDGVLAVKPVDIGLAGGHLVGEFTFDGRQKALAAHAAIELREVRLEKLIARSSEKPKGAGALQGRLDLKGKGESIAKIAASASGTVEIVLAGGAISNLLDAEIGLNAGKAVKVLVRGDRAIGVNNATAAFDFDDGVGKSKTLVLDTDQTRTEGAGTLDLRNESVDLVLTPHPKKTTMLALHSSIRVKGPIRKPKFSLGAKSGAKGEGCPPEVRPHRIAAGGPHGSRLVTALQWPCATLAIDRVTAGSRRAPCGIESRAGIPSNPLAPRSGALVAPVRWLRGSTHTGSRKTHGQGGQNGFRHRQAA